MKVSQKVWEQFQQAEKAVISEADAWVGAKLKWAEDPSSMYSYSKKPYKGRIAEVQAATYCDRTGRILVKVRTASLKEGQWLDDNDNFHRTYYELDLGLFELPRTEKNESK